MCASAHSWPPSCSLSEVVIERTKSPGEIFTPASPRLVDRLRLAMLSRARLRGTGDTSNCCAACAHQLVELGQLTPSQNIPQLRRLNLRRYVGSSHSSHYNCTHGNASLRS